MFVLKEKISVCLTAPFFHKVWHHKEEDKNVQQTSDLILQGVLHALHPALSLRIYISHKNSSQFNKEPLRHLQWNHTTEAITKQFACLEKEIHTFQVIYYYYESSSSS